MTYHIARGEEKLGEFNDLDIAAGMREGTFMPTDLCWAAGWAEWEPLSQHFSPPEPRSEAKSAATVPAEATGEVFWSTTTRPGDLELASRLRRLLAWTLDWLTLLPALFMLLQAIQFNDFALKHQNTPKDQLLTELQRHVEAVVTAHPDAVMLPYQLLFGIAVLNVVLLTLRGQTVGKWLVRIRIVKFQTGQKPGFVSVVVLRSMVILALGMLPYVGLGLFVGNVFGIFRHDRRCLHDMIADTMVILQR